MHNLKRIEIGSISGTISLAHPYTPSLTRHHPLAPLPSPVSPFTRAHISLRYMTSVYIGISIILCACDLHLYFLAIVCLYVINKFTRYHQTPLYCARTWGEGRGGWC